MLGRRTAVNSGVGVGEAGATASPIPLPGRENKIKLTFIY